MVVVVAVVVEEKMMVVVVVEEEEMVAAVVVEEEEEKTPCDGENALVRDKLTETQVQPLHSSIDERKHLHPSCTAPAPGPAPGPAPATHLQLPAVRQVLDPNVGDVARSSQRQRQQLSAALPNVEANLVVHHCAVAEVQVEQPWGSPDEVGNGGRIHGGASSLFRRELPDKLGEADGGAMVGDQAAEEEEVCQRPSGARAVKAEPVVGRGVLVKLSQALIRAEAEDASRLGPVVLIRARLLLPALVVGAEAEARMEVAGLDGEGEVGANFLQADLEAGHAGNIRSSLHLQVEQELDTSLEDPPSLPRLLWLDIGVSLCQALERKDAVSDPLLAPREPLRDSLVPLQQRRRLLHPPQPHQQAPVHSQGGD
eukprot:745888-Hanusia_phi.AAC.1